MEKFKFTPKQWVLTRDEHSDKWGLNIFSHSEYNTEEECEWFYCVGGWAYQCIPYNDETAHLLNTTDDYVEPYEPKDGDFVYCEGDNRHIIIFKDIKDDTIHTYIELLDNEQLREPFVTNKSIMNEFRLATEEEKQLLLSKLAEIGKKWNPEKKCIEDVWTPKDGDFIYVSTHISPRGYIFISKGNRKLTTYYVCYDVQEGWASIDGACCANDDIQELRPATDSEKQQLLDALHKEGKDWDESKKEIVEYICMKRGRKYFYFDFSGTIRETTWADLPTEREMYKNGFISFTHKDAADKYRKVTELLKGGQE